MNPAVKDPAEIFIVGCGDIGRRVAARWQQRGIPVRGMVRQQHSASLLQKQGITPVVANLDHPATLSVRPRGNTLLYYFAPPPASGREDTRMRHWLASLDPQQLPSRMVLISTSGVYGDRQGALVNEETPPNPQVDRAWRRLDAEQQLRRFGRQHRLAVVILRVGGIYAADRLPVKRIEKGVPVLHERLAPHTNRIHAEDLARVCVEAGRRGRADTVYNVSDGDESNMTAYFNTVADFLGLPRPPALGWEEAENRLSAGMLSYLRESRRLDNRRMLQEFGITLKYPDLQSGLAAG